MRQVKDFSYKARGEHEDSSCWNCVEVPLKQGSSRASFFSIGILFTFLLRRHSGWCFYQVGQLRKLCNSKAFSVVKPARQRCLPIWLLNSH
mmetsp:Transcript_87841/g.253661  ORF Transcript_87841/g.253661 Transcript_87841/m.253661 type:complete len:91 (-) Transcript_87841:289-561(-)